MKLETLKEEKGITIYLVLIVLVVTLGASLGLSSIFLRQLRLVGGVGEEMNLLPEAERTLDNGAQYDFAIEDPGGDCEGNNDWGYCATSTGSFEGVVRRVEIVR